MTPTDWVTAASAPTTTPSTSRRDTYPTFSYIRLTNMSPSTRSPPLIPPHDRPSSQLQMQSEFLHVFAPKLLPQLAVLRSAYHHRLPSPRRLRPLRTTTIVHPHTIPPRRAPPTHPHPRASRATLAAVVLPCARAAAWTTRDCGERRPTCPHPRPPHAKDEVLPVDLPFVFLVAPCAVPISARVYVHVSFAQALKRFFGRALS
ncbi:hypothetical protein C8R44DRAFT_881101 [Mycena epipterygia]|nr:hypothetical protein C8R44DRAFT_881101 [Mycena epipterygia]